MIHYLIEKNSRSCLLYDVDFIILKWQNWHGWGCIAQCPEINSNKISNTIHKNYIGLTIPRKIMLSPYAKKCIVFYHTLRTKCWYWINTSTLSDVGLLSLSAHIQSAGIELIPALSGLIIHTLVISKFFCSFFPFLISLKI